MMLRLACILTVITGACAMGAELPDTVQFNRDVRPILSSNCYACHGPDAAERKAKLRLDVDEHVFKERDGYFVIKPGAPADSVLFQHITSADPDDVMPPPKTHKKLSATDKAVIKKSIW